MASEWKRYRRTAIAEMRPVEAWETEATLFARNVSISRADRDAGSPKPGDMIARNPKDHTDQWLVAAEYFADNFAPLTGGSDGE